MRNYLYSKYLTYFLVFQILFIQLISRFPNFIENHYSNGIYQYISVFFRILFGWVPFSIGDIIYGTIAIIAIRFIYIIIRDKFTDLRAYICALGGFVSVLYFVFYFFWGLNYYRQPLTQQLALNNTSYTTQELIDFTKILITKTNAIHLNITKNDTVQVAVPYSQKEIYKRTQQGYATISKEIPSLKYKYTSVKNSLMSTALTYMGFSGYLSPFSGEAHVNRLIPKVSYPVTTCHEVAHQLGYAAENEANFIGFLAAINNKDTYFQYSGYLMALRYSLSEVYKRDPQLFKTLVKSIHKGILKNIQESREFWESYKNPFEFIFKHSYNAYLKANKQKKGIKSYSYFVGIMIDYFNSEDS